MRRPADLALDLLDEPLDPAGGGDGLFPLEVDEGFLVFHVREIDLESAARDEGAADQHGEEDDVLAKEAPARPAARGTHRRASEGDPEPATTGAPLVIIASLGGLGTSKGAPGRRARAGASRIANGP